MENESFDRCTVADFAELFTNLAKRNPEALVSIVYYDDDNNKTHWCPRTKDLKLWVSQKYKQDSDGVKKIGVERIPKHACQNLQVCFDCVSFEGKKKLSKLLAQKYKDLGEAPYKDVKEMLKHLQSGDFSLDQICTELNAKNFWYPGPWYVVPDGKYGKIYNKKTFANIVSADNNRTFFNDPNEWKKLFVHKPGTYQVFVCKLSYDELVEEKIIRVSNIDRVLRNKKRQCPFGTNESHAAEDRASENSNFQGIDRAFKISKIV